MNTYRKILSLFVAAVIVVPMTLVPAAFADSTSQQTSNIQNTNGIVVNGVQSTSGTISTAPYQLTLANFNAGTGNNQLLVVGVQANNNNVVSITFGGAQLTKATESFANNDAEFWYLANPSGTGDIVVTMAGSTSAVVGAYSISGVDLTNPIPTKATSHSTSSGSPSVSITTQYPNSLVLDLPSIYGSVTLGSPTGTQNWDLNIASEITGASSSTLQATAGAATYGWTASGAGDAWDDAAIEVKAAETSGGSGGGSSSCGTQTSIASNFNGNSIAGGNTIWFNSNFDLTSGATDGLTIYFTGQTITSNDFTASVPDSEIIFSSSATSATTTFDTTHNMWVTTVPLGFADDVFLSGLAYHVPPGGLPGGENPVTWSGTISGSSPFSMQWKWGAAVYTSFDDYNTIGVKPVHSTSLDAYNNGDQAGTPENEKNNVIGGARGGGGSNWTGSWSATVAASSSCTAPPPNRVTLTVNTQFANGTALPGMFVELQNSAGSDIATSFSPATFSVNSGQPYGVMVNNFGCDTFAYWLDTNSAVNPRSISITSDTTLTAVYTVNCPSGGGGGTGGGNGTGGGGGTGGSGGLPNCGPQTSISSNFNGNDIAAGNTIWFNSNFDLTSTATDGETLYFTGQTITSNDFTASVPDSEVIFSSSATSATTTFDTTHDMWVTTVPLGFGNDIFLSGLAYQVPAGGLPGGINPVTWSGTISGSAPFSIQWKWGAAVYTSFSDYNSIGVKPVHSTSLDAYNNGDQAGTPENEKSNVIGGARGGGGSNWTGSWSATVAASGQACPPSSGGGGGTGGQVSLTVNDVDMNGNALTGYAVELQDTNGNTLVTNYTPAATFTLNAGQTYNVEADSFGSCTFNHWSDTGATGEIRSVSIQSDTTLTAVLSCS